VPVGVGVGVSTICSGLPNSVIAWLCMRVSLEFFAWRQSDMFKPGLSCPGSRQSATELSRQTGELRYGKLFRSRRRRDACGTDAFFRIGGEALQALAQHFAPLAKRGRGHPFEIGETCGCNG